MKRAFTFEYIVAWAGKRSFLLFSHKVWSSLRKTESLAQGWGGLFEVQIVVCCSHRRQRQTEALPPLFSPPSLPHLHCCQMSKTWPTTLKFNTYEAAINGNNMIEFMLWFVFFPNVLSQKSQVQQYSHLLNVSISLFGILPLNYL